MTTGREECVRGRVGPKRAAITAVDQAVQESIMVPGNRELQVVSLVACLVLACACKPTTPTTPSCSSGSALFGGGPLSGGGIEGLHFDSTGLMNQELPLGIGETKRIKLVVLRPTDTRACPSTFERFLYIKWNWNHTTQGPPIPQFPVPLSLLEIPPQAGPADVRIETCDCSPWSGPVWTTYPNTNVANGEWVQRAWLAGPQTVTFSVTGVHTGQTMLFLAGLVAGPCTNPDGDCGPYDWDDVTIRVSER